MIKKTSIEWARQLNVALEWEGSRECYSVIVLDPDGWDRKNWQRSIEEEISIAEFGFRLAFSTCDIVNLDDYQERFSKLLSDKANTTEKIERVSEEALLTHDEDMALSALQIAEKLNEVIDLVNKLIEDRE